VHVVAPADAEYLFLGHTVHIDEPAVEVFPAGHDVQVEAPAVEYFPAGQVVHDPAREEEYFPAGHVIHDVALAVEYFPAAHATHELPLLYVPAPQLFVELLPPGLEVVVVLEAAPPRIARYVLEKCRFRESLVATCACLRV
jgi:hypothetical protein